MSKLLNTFYSDVFSATVVEKEVKEKPWHKVGVKTREIVFSSPKYLAYFLKEKCKPNDQLSVTITNKKPKRSENQNRFLWLYYSVIAKESGNSEIEVHEWAKSACMPSRIVKVFGDPVRMKQSTTELTVNEFNEFISKIQERTGVPIPDTTDFNLTGGFRER